MTVLPLPATPTAVERGCNEQETPMPDEKKQYSRTQRERINHAYQTAQAAENLPPLRPMDGRAWLALMALVYGMGLVTGFSLAYLLGLVQALW